MRKLIVSTYVTLDGAFEPGDWHFGVFNDEMADFAREQLFAADALLLGRRTYDVLAETWPSIADEVGFADRMNAMPKYVVSSTLDATTWNNSTVIRGDVRSVVERLKQQPGQDILLYGSAQLMRALALDGLIDEYRLWLHPSVVGQGERLFPNGGPATPMRLTDLVRFTNGVVVLTYVPVGEIGATNWVAGWSTVRTR